MNSWSDCQISLKTIMYFLFLTKVIECWISITEYLRYQYGVTQVNPSVNLHLRHYNKQQLIPAKFYTNSTPFIGNQAAKFQ